MDLRHALVQRYVAFKKQKKDTRDRRNILRHGFWFVGIPRTSSTSLRSELGQAFGAVHSKSTVPKKYSPGIGRPPHQRARSMRRFVGRDEWDALLTFSIVRNPWDRMVSLYNYRVRVGSISADWAFEDYVTQSVAATAKTPEFEFHGWRLSNSDYITDRAGNVIVKEIIRFEDRYDALADIGRRIGLDTLGQVHTERTQDGGRAYRQAYSDRTRDLVAERYAEDIERFGYEF